MGRTKSRTKKGRSDAQKHVTATIQPRAAEANRRKWPQSEAAPFPEDRRGVQVPAAPHIAPKAIDYKAKYEALAKKYYNERRRTSRLIHATERRKEDEKRRRAEEYRLRGVVMTLQNELRTVKRDAEGEVGRLQAEVKRLKEVHKELHQSRTALLKCYKRLKHAETRLKKRLQEVMRNRPSVFKLMVKGAYSRQARTLARYLVRNGMAESKVGAAIQKVGEILGIEVKGNMSKRSVHRAILEGGIAADIQLVFEIASASSEYYSLYVCIEGSPFT